MLQIQVTLLSLQHCKPLHRYHGLRHTIAEGLQSTLKPQGQNQLDDCFWIWICVSAAQSNHFYELRQSNLLLGTCLFPWSEQS